MNVIESPQLDLPGAKAHSRYIDRGARAASLEKHSVAFIGGALAGNAELFKSASTR